MTIRAQDGYTTHPANGGNLFLSSGAKNSSGTDGYVAIETGGNIQLEVSPTVVTVTSLAGNGDGYVGVHNSGNLFFTSTIGSGAITLSGEVTGPGNATVVSGPFSTATLEWEESITSPTLTIATPTSNLTPQNLEIHGQYPWSGSSGAGELPGSVTVTLYDPKFQLAGGFLIQYGSTPLIRMGEYVGNGADSGVIWFKDGGAPSTSNWNIRGTASALYLNAPSGGNMIFEVGATGTVWLEINASGVILPQLAGSGSGYATIDNSG